MSGTSRTWHAWRRNRPRFPILHSYTNTQNSLVAPVRMMPKRLDQSQNQSLHALIGVGHYEDGSGSGSGGGGGGGESVGQSRHNSSRSRIRQLHDQHFTIRSTSQMDLCERIVPFRIYPPLFIHAGGAMNHVRHCSLASDTQYNMSNPICRSISTS